MFFYAVHFLVHGFFRIVCISGRRCLAVVARDVNRFHGHGRVEPVVVQECRRTPRMKYFPAHGPDPRYEDIAYCANCLSSSRVSSFRPPEYFISLLVFFSSVAIVAFDCERVTARVTPAFLALKRVAAGVTPFEVEETRAMLLSFSGSCSSDDGSSPGKGAGHS